MPNEKDEAIIKLETVCPFCGKKHIISLTSEQYERYKKWVMGDGLIQDLLPDLTSSQRELLKTGIDDICWNKM